MSMSLGKCFFHDRKKRLQKNYNINRKQKGQTI